MRSCASAAAAARQSVQRAAIQTPGRAGRRAAVAGGDDGGGDDSGGRRGRHGAPGPLPLPHHARAAAAARHHVRRAHLRAGRHPPVAPDARHQPQDGPATAGQGARQGRRGRRRLPRRHARCRPRCRCVARRSSGRTTPCAGSWRSIGRSTACRRCHCGRPTRASASPRRRARPALRRCSSPSSSSCAPLPRHPAPASGAGAGADGADARQLHAPASPAAAGRAGACAERESAPVAGVEPRPVRGSRAIVTRPSLQCTVRRRPLGRVARLVDAADRAPCLLTLQSTPAAQFAHAPHHRRETGGAAPAALAGAGRQRSSGSSRPSNRTPPRSHSATRRPLPSRACRRRSASSTPRATRAWWRP